MKSFHNKTSELILKGIKIKSGFICVVHLLMCVAFIQSNL